jgi:hypothetical protein
MGRQSSSRTKKLSCQCDPSLLGHCLLEEELDADCPSEEAEAGESVCEAVTEPVPAEAVADATSELTGVRAAAAGLGSGLKSDDQVPAGRSNTNGPGSATPSPPKPVISVIPYYADQVGHTT